MKLRSDAASALYAMADALSRELGSALSVVSAYRTHGHQARLNP